MPHRSAFHSEAATNEVQEFFHLLENATFVDYFNIFLCLPIFGQRAVYKFATGEFEFEPQIPNDKLLHLDTRVPVQWLCSERFRLFKNCPLYTECKLCMLLHQASFDRTDITNQDGECDVDQSSFVKNILGTALGMLLFRESLRDTCGEKVYRCWKDIEAWWQIKDPIRRLYWKNVIKSRYIRQNRPRGKHTVRPTVYGDMLNFDIYPETDNLHKNYGKRRPKQVFVSSEDSSLDVLLQLQSILLEALKKYWLPRYILHIMKVTPKEILKVFFQRSAADIRKERRKWSNIMFPTTDQQCTSETPTSLFESKSADEIEKSVEIETDFSYSFANKDDSEAHHRDLFSLCAGPTREIFMKSKGPPTPVTSSLKDNNISSLNSSDSNFSSLSDQDNLSNVQNLSDDANAVTTSIPTVFASFLYGKQLTQIVHAAKTPNRIAWFLASDILACYPFRLYLQRHEQTMALHCLSFWSDVRNYLDIDDTVIDCFGHSLKSTYAHRIVETYLSKEGYASGIFSHEFSRSLFNALMVSNDVSLLCTAQEMVQKRLKTPLKNFMQDDRNHALIKIMGFPDHKSNKMNKHLKQLEIMQCVDSAFFSQYISPKSVQKSSTCQLSLSSSSLSSTPTTASETTGHLYITEEQMKKATEIIILCNEYGSSMIMPQYLPSLQQVADGLQSGLGSVHEPKDPIVRHEWLKSLLKKPKVDIEKIKVSRKVIEDKIDLTQFRDLHPMDAPPEFWNKRRRFGVNNERPPKPRCFMDILKNQPQFEYFKRFLILRRADQALAFWKAVEGVKRIQNTKDKTRAITNIVHKYFGKDVKRKLGCDDDIIRQIQTMKHVTVGVLCLAQGIVFRAIERKWFAQYLDTFPLEDLTPEEIKQHNAASKDEKSKKLLKAVAMREKWRKVTRALTEFNTTVMGKHGHLFDFFLIYEVEKEIHMNMDPPKSSDIEKNIMANAMAENVRVIVGNKLITLNKLPYDLNFWREIKRYQELVDTQKTNKHFVWFTDFLMEKAICIKQCFLESEVSPRVQVNLPSEIVSKVIHNINNGGPVRGVFHDAVITLFPLLYHYYLKYNEALMSGNLSKQYIHFMKRDFKDDDDWDSIENIQDFASLKATHLKYTEQLDYDPSMLTIHYTISDGVSYVYPCSKTMEKMPSTRVHKHSLTSLSESSGNREGHVHFNIKTDFARNLDKYHAKYGQCDPTQTSLPPVNNLASSSEKSIDMDPSKRSSKFDVTRNQYRRVSEILTKINMEKEAILHERMHKKRVSVANVVGNAYEHKEREKNHKLKQEIFKIF